MNLKLDGFSPVFTPTMTKAGKVDPAAKGINSAGSPETAEQALSAKTDLFENKSDRLAMLEEMLKNSREQSENSAEEFDSLSKCMTIAARIMNGDHVPQKDHKYLAEKYPELYEQAILLRRVNRDPKDYKALTEDEEEENPLDPGSDGLSVGGSSPLGATASDMVTEIVSSSFDAEG